MKKLILATLICVAGLQKISCQASDDMEVDSPPALSPPSAPSANLQPDFKSIDDIHALITTAYSKAEWKDLKSAYDIFAKLSLSEETWGSYAEQHKIDYRWPSQTTWKEQVGAHLFFHPQTLDWFDCPYRNHLLKRFDIIWGFAINAKLKDPRGKYLLCNTLQKIRRHRKYAEVPILTEFFEGYFGNAIQELKSYEDDPDACYLLGCGITEDFFTCISRYDETLSAHDLFRRHPDHLRNKYHALTSASQESTMEDFLMLAQRGYSRAYSDVIEFLDNIEDTILKENILKEIFEKEHDPTLLLDRGYLLYDEPEDNDKAKELQASIFRQVTEKYRIATGYIELGILRIEANHFTKETADLFRKAGETHDPRGWEYLIKFWEEKYKISKAKADKDNLSASIKEGMRVGLPYAYSQAQHYFSPEFFLELIRMYGAPLQGDIRINWSTSKEIPFILESQSELIEKFLTES